MNLLQEAVVILREAALLDNDNKPNDAWYKYLQGIEKLMEHRESLSSDDPKKKALEEKISNYMKRAEVLRSSVKVQVRFLEQRKIEANSTGHGYDKVFGRFINDQLTGVTVQDAYIKVHHQVLNFVRFCELMVTGARNLKSITLITAKDCRSNEDAFSELSDSLKGRKVFLTVQYVDNLHDREIRFNNGWVVKIGRGLDYFKNPGRYAIGSCDMNLRMCHETTIDMFKEES